MKLTFNRHSFLRFFAPSFPRLFSLKKRDFDYLITGRCVGCGKCCISINLKYKKGWIRSEKQFLTLLKNYPEYDRFQMASKDSSGYLQFNCAWFDKRYGCRDYKNRLDICKKYPTKSIFLEGGVVHQGCGFSIKEAKSFERYLLNEKRKIKKK